MQEYYIPTLGHLRMAGTCMHACSVMSNSATPWAVARQAPLSMEYWKWFGVICHFLLQVIFLTHGLNPCLLHFLYWQADYLPLCHLGSPNFCTQKLGACMHAKSRLILCDPIDCRLPGCSVHGILQARRLKWVAISSFRGSSRLRDWTRIPYVSYIDRQIIDYWATWESNRGLGWAITGFVKCISSLTFYKDSVPVCKRNFAVNTCITNHLDSAINVLLLISHIYSSSVSLTNFISLKRKESNIANCSHLFNLSGGCVGVFYINLAFVYFQSVT